MSAANNIYQNLRSRLSASKDELAELTSARQRALNEIRYLTSAELAKMTKEVVRRLPASVKIPLSRSVRAKFLAPYRVTREKLAAEVAAEFDEPIDSLAHDVALFEHDVVEADRLPEPIEYAYSPPSAPEEEDDDGENISINQYGSTFSHISDRTPEEFLDYLVANVPEGAHASLISGDHPVNTGNFDMSVRHDMEYAVGVFKMGSSAAAVSGSDQVGVNFGSYDGAADHGGMFNGFVNCCINVYRGDMRGDKSDKAKRTRKQFDALLESAIPLWRNLKTTGFLREHAEAIRDKIGFGFQAYDRLGGLFIDVAPRNPKEKIVRVQSFDTHGYKLTDAVRCAQIEKQRATQIKIVSRAELAKLVIDTCEQVARPIYRRLLGIPNVADSRQLAALIVGDTEYKLYDYPLGVFCPVDLVSQHLRKKYEQNFAQRDPLEQRWLRDCDFHVPTIWYNKPQFGTEIDFNQAFRSSAELKLSRFTRFELPTYPTFWMSVDASDEQQTLAFDIITKYTGFAEATINIKRVVEPLRSHLQSIYVDNNRTRFTSPEIEFFMQIDVEMVFSRIAFNADRQTIDWQFAADVKLLAEFGAEDEFNSGITDVRMPTYCETLDRVAKQTACHAIGRLITKNREKDEKCDKLIVGKSEVSTNYYLGVLNNEASVFNKKHEQSGVHGRVIDVDTTNEKYNVIRYRMPVAKTNQSQQYHIHSYILAYLRLAMLDLLADIPVDNIIKINYDAVHVKKLDFAIPFKIDNARVGCLGGVKVRAKRTPGMYTKHSGAVDVAAESSINDFSSLWTETVADPIEPRKVILGGAGAGKSYSVREIKPRVAISAYTNELTDDIRETSIAAGLDWQVATMHSMYGVKPFDKTYQVTKMPRQHVHCGDDLRLAPTGLAKSIKRALEKHNKRVIFTLDPGQASLDPIKADRMLDRLTNEYLCVELKGSHRMDNKLFTIAQKFRNDPRHVVGTKWDRELDRLVKYAKSFDNKVNGDELDWASAELMDKYIKEKTREAIAGKIYSTTEILNELIIENELLYMTTAEFVEIYAANPSSYTIMSSTHRRAEMINEMIVKLDPSIHKYKYMKTSLGRKTDSEEESGIRRTNKVIMIHRDKVAKAERLQRDIHALPKRIGALHDPTPAACHQHVGTIFSKQGKTIDGLIAIDCGSAFAQQQIYTAMTRVKSVDQIIFFGDRPIYLPLPPAKIDAVLHAPPTNPTIIRGPLTAIPGGMSRKYMTTAEFDCQPTAFDVWVDRSTGLNPKGTHYYRFSNPESFAHWSASDSPEWCNFHETISRPIRRICVDIDGEHIDAAEWDSLPEIYIAKFIATFERYFGIVIARDQLAVIISSGMSVLKGKPKFSMQIRTLDYVCHREVNRDFALNYFRREFVGEQTHLGQAVDRGVYKSRQNFRIVGSTKFGDGRNSRMLFGTDNCFVGTYSDVIEIGRLKRIELECKSTKRQSQNITRAFQQKIIEAAAPYTANMTYKYLRGTHSFLRNGVESYCHCCSRTHTTDNMFVTMDGGVVSLKCWRGGKPIQLLSAEPSISDINCREEPTSAHAYDIDEFNRGDGDDSDDEGARMLRKSCSDDDSDDE